MAGQFDGDDDFVRYEDETHDVDHEIDDDYDEYWEDDGQPDEYTEWQDYYGGDDWDHGQFDNNDW